MRVLEQSKQGYRHIGWAEITEPELGLLKVPVPACVSTAAHFLVAWVPKRDGASRTDQERIVLVRESQDPSVLPGWRPVRRDEPVAA